MNQASDTNLVDHLCELAGTGTSEKLAHAGIDRDHLLGARIGGGIAAAHDRQDTVLGAGLAA